MKMADKVAIGWLDPGTVDGMFCMSVASIYAERLSRVEGLLRVQAGGLLSRGRNELVAQFLTHTSAQWLLMLDSDMCFKRDRVLTDFDALLSTAHDTERPIVAGLYFGAWPGEHFPTPVPLIFNTVEGTTTFRSIVDYQHRPSPLQVDSAGTGCLLIHRSVFEKLQSDASPHQGQNWCWFQDMPVNGDWFSEDHYFCARVREVGFPIYANTDVVLEHHKQVWLSDRQYVYTPEVTDG
jgi:hypothetical protein